MKNKQKIPDEKMRTPVGTRSVARAVSAKKWHFSLLEILVVVAIIVILVSLLFPAVRKVKEMAKRMNCLARCKDLAQMNQRFASRNEYVATLQNLPSGDPDEDGFYAGRNFYRWQEIILKDEIGSAVPNMSPEWWKVACDNVLHGWNMSWGGWGVSWFGPYTSSGDPNLKTQGGWGFLNRKDVQISYNCISFLGHYYTNYNFLGSYGSTYRFCWKNNGNVGTENSIRISLSNIRSPGNRTYVVESGEDRGDDNAFSIIKLKGYGTQINGQYGGGSPGYIAGYGGGGVGKESIESTGYSSYVQGLDKYGGYEMIRRDVEEGRHDGYTLHGFFDGSARAITAREVGMNQLKSGQSQTQLTGLYSPVDSPAEE